MRTPIRSFRDLEVWQESVELFVEVTNLIRKLPIGDRLIFQTQTWLAARSISANISEGHLRRYTGDYLRLLSYARGSLGEVESDLVLIGRCSTPDEKELQRCFARADVIGRKLTRLMSSLRAKQGQRTRKT